LRGGGFWAVAARGVRKPLSVSQSAMRRGQVFTVTSLERSPMLKAWRPLARKIASTGTLAAVSFWNMARVILSQP
jgi:hypothetical protein